MKSSLAELMADDTRWYLQDDTTMVGAMVTDNASRIWRDEEHQRRLMVQCENLYNSTQCVGLTPRAYRTRLNNLRQKPISFNGIQAVCDTYQALVTKDIPKMSFLTAGGDWGLQQRASRLEKFCDGTAYENDFALTLQQCALESAIHPFGLVQCYIDESRGRPRIVNERCKPWQLLADDQDAYHGNPQTFYYIDFIDKLVLIERYPDHKDAILAASVDTFDDTLMSQLATTVESNHYCVVVEAYHLRQSEDVLGRCAVVVDQTVLEDHDYEYYTAPFKRLYRKRPRFGIYGQSLADELAPDQIELMMLLAIAQKANKNVVGHWFIPRGAAINTNKLDNVVGSFQEFSGGQPPVYIAAKPASSDIYSHMDRIWGRMFERIGVSQMAAAGVKPPGLNSGKAQLVYADVQSQRFEPCYRELQHFVREVVDYNLQLAATIAKKYPHYEVKAPGKKMMEAVKWADAHLEESEYVLQIKPSNALADDPAALLQTSQDMANTGQIKMGTARRLLNDIPDLQEAMAYENASYDNVMRCAQQMIDVGEYIPPEPYMQLVDTPEDDGAVTLMQQVYLKAKLDGVPEDRLGLLRRWIDQAAGMQPPPPQAPGPPGLPPGPGMGGGGLAGRTNVLMAKRMAAETADSMM